MQSSPHTKQPLTSILILGTVEVEATLINSSTTTLSQVMCVFVDEHKNTPRLGSILSAVCMCEWLNVCQYTLAIVMYIVPTLIMASLSLSLSYQTVHTCIMYISVCIVRLLLCKDQEATMLL